jgi:hypothetical protein
VDPQAETAALRRRLTAAGWGLTAVRSGTTSRAFGARRDGDPPLSLVRVVTARGVALALDSHETDGFRLRHGPVEVRVELPPDVDGDGAEEVLVRRGDGCLEVYRVLEGGFVTPVATEAARVDRDACPTRAADLEGDGVLELLVPLAWPELALDASAIPAIEVPLTADGGAWRAGRPHVAWLAAERAAREAALEEAVRRLDRAAVQRAAVERAALAHLAGASLSRQLADYDADTGRVVFGEAEVPRLDRTRERVASGWAAR